MGRVNDFCDIAVMKMATFPGLKANFFLINVISVFIGPAYVEISNNHLEKVL
jgi:hypothetical protein